MYNARSSVSVIIVSGAVFIDDELPKGLGSQFRGTSHAHELYRQLYMWTRAEGTHHVPIVAPQSELLLPNPSLAHSPKIGYFATNYLQM